MVTRSRCFFNGYSKLAKNLLFLRENINLLKTSIGKATGINLRVFAYFTDSDFVHS